MLQGAAKKKKIPQNWGNDLVHMDTGFQIVIIMGNPKRVELLNLNYTHTQFATKEARQWRKDNLFNK